MLNNSKFKLLLTSSLVLSLTACFGSGTNMFRGDAEHTGAYSSDLDELSELNWKFPTGVKSYSSPVFADDLIFFGNNKGIIHAIDSETGVLKWNIPTKGNIESTGAVSEGVLYIGSWDGYLYAIDINAKLIKWKFKTQGIVYSSPTVVDGLVLFGSEDKHLYALDALQAQKNGVLRHRLVFTLLLQ